MRESKEDRFCRLAEARVNKIIKMVQLLGNCAGNAYKYTDGQVEQIFGTLENELDKAKSRYSATDKRFSLSDGHQEYPTIYQKVGENKYLRAQAIDDEDFPAINIDLMDGDNPAEKVCFVELNSERKEGHNICIGVYTADKDDTVFYGPYLPECSNGYSYTIGDDDTMTVWENNMILCTITGVTSSSAEKLFKEVVFELREVDLDKNDTPENGRKESL